MSLIPTEPAPGSMGLAIVRDLLRITFALHLCWRRSTFRDRRRSGILDQEVDKFALLFLECLRNAKFPVTPFAVTPGRHGPGLTLRNGEGGLTYLCDIIELYNGLPIFREREIYYIEHRQQRKFTPQIVPSDYDKWAAKQRVRGPESEVEFVNTFAQLVVPLSPVQMIALGRHIDQDETARALDSLGRQLERPWEVLHGYRDTNEQSSSEMKAIQDIYEICRVAVTKITTDHDHYREARRLIAREPHDSLAKRAILRARGAADDIWFQEKVKRAGAPWQQRYDWARLVWASAQCGASWVASGIRGRRAESPADELQDAALKCGLGVGPEQPIPVHDLRQGRWKPVLHRLGEVLGLAGRGV